MRLLALGDKARLYGYELRFARKAVPDPRQRWALLRHTVAFHWENRDNNTTNKKKLDERYYKQDR